MIAKTDAELTPSDLSIDAIVELERIEMHAWADMFAAAPDDFSRHFGLSAKRMNDFMLFAIKKSPRSLHNRSLGMGLARSVDKATLEEAVGWLRDHCGPAWGIPLAAAAQPADLPGWLSEKGMTPKPGMARFRRLAIGPALEVHCRYEVRLVTAEHATDFGLVAKEGFEMDEGFDTWRAALCGRPYWHTYVAYDGSTPVGAGAMFIEDGLAWLGIGTTLPAYRGRGVQRAVLARRVSDAAALGAKIVTVETFHASGQPPNDSTRNVIRAGFSFAYFRPEYISQ
jgi:GNAT superfamily N-acetyltransferase